MRNFCGMLWQIIRYGRGEGYGGTPLAHPICFLFVYYAPLSPHKLTSYMDHSFLLMPNKYTHQMHASK